MNLLLSYFLFSKFLLQNLFYVIGNSLDYANGNAISELLI